MISLLYNRDFQMQLVLNLLSDPKWFAEVYRTLHLSDFDLPACSLVFEISRSYFDKYQTIPPKSVLMIEVERACTQVGQTYETIVPTPEMETLAYLMGLICSNPPQVLAPDYYRRELKDYIAFVRMGNMSTQLGSNGTPSQHIAEILKINESLTKLGSSSNIKWSDAMQEIPAEENTNAMRMGTGLYEIDSQINGGLKNGQIGMLVACSGVGKTMGMINFGINAALRGLYSLFITLENPSSMIMSRFQCMMGNIDAKWMSQPYSMWPAPELSRLRYINGPNFMFRNRMRVADCSTKTQTVGEIESIIVQWKAKLAEQADYNEDKCYIVYVDWLEKLDWHGTPGIDRNTPPDVIWQKVLEYLGEIGRRNNVQIWTATQATRDAYGREVIEARHIAHSVHTLDPLDVAVGLAPQIDINATGVDTAHSSLPTGETQRPCNRTMNASFIKVREAQVAGKVSAFYQGKTLRFWPSKACADTAENLANNNDMAALYSGMLTQRK